MRLPGTIEIQVSGSCPQNFDSLGITCISIWHSGNTYFYKFRDHTMASTGLTRNDKVSTPRWMCLIPQLSIISQPEIPEDVNKTGRLKTSHLSQKQDWESKLICYGQGRWLGHWVLVVWACGPKFKLAAPPWEARHGNTHVISEVGEGTGASLGLTDQPVLSTDDLQVRWATLF